MNENLILLYTIYNMLYSPLFLLLCTLFFTHVSTKNTTQPLLECSNSTEIVEFQHNFCESRLQHNKGPELYNAYTSLFITTVPLFLGFPQNEAFYNVAYALFFNGFASFYYHYYLTWIGKQADEISMIFANYFGIVGLINLRFQNKKNLKLLHFMNLLYMYQCLIFNTIIQFDKWFPLMFGLYITPAIFLIRDIATIHNVEYKKYLAISTIGFLSWMISEIFCNEYTVYGHVVWHFLFPLGFYFIIMKYDKIYTRVQKQRFAIMVSETQ